MKVHLRTCWLLVAAAVFAGCTMERSVAQNLKGNVRLYRELDDVELKGSWYFEDLAGARQEAKRTGKPLLVVLRCPP